MEPRVWRSSSLRIAPLLLNITIAPLLLNTLSLSAPHDPGQISAQRMGPFSWKREDFSHPPQNPRHTHPSFLRSIQTSTLPCDNTYNTQFLWAIQCCRDKIIMMNDRMIEWTNDCDSWEGSKIWACFCVFGLWNQSQPATLKCIQTCRNVGSFASIHNLIYNSPSNHRVYIPARRRWIWIFNARWAHRVFLSPKT